MKDQWHGSNVDLYKLHEGIKQFFTQRQFELSDEKIQDGYQFTAATQKILGVQLKIHVNLYGDPNDFTIEFITDAKRKGFLSSSMVLSYMATIIGGGAFLRSELRLRESLDKLEKTFWEHVDKQIADLTNSAPINHSVK